ncbi:transposase, partial [Gluconobacter oxydans]
MAFPVPNPKAMLADRGYDSDGFRQDLLFRGILPVIP